MIHFDELLKLGQDDINTLISHLRVELSKEGLVFERLEGYVMKWVSRYLDNKEVCAHCQECHNCMEE